MASASETLCGQAFGAGKIYLVGIYMQRSSIILIVASILLCPIYIFAAPVKLQGQEDDIADVAGKFTLLFIPQLFSLAITFPYSKVPSSIGQSRCAGLDWFRSSCYSHRVSRALHCWVRMGNNVMGGSDFPGLLSTRFGRLLVRLSLASAVMLCLQIWYMISIAVLTGHLDNAVIAIDALSRCMNING
ncbi:Multi antimicrobial extrusion protein [Dillenia turbinata]|uniref:Multi antimicrobial extrusion protein n=1 Tax=Dillenia turbinata TaxID=194707 RepID=A0AAN8VMD8_9MAGN